MKHLLLASTALTLLVSAGCERKSAVAEPPTVTAPLPPPVAKTKTLETARLGDTVDAYTRDPSPETSAEAKKAFAKLDGEIAKLEEYIAKHDGEQRAVAEGKLANMKEYRDAESKRFTAAQVTSPLSPTDPVDTRSGLQKLESSARKAGSTIEDKANNAGDRVKEAAH